ncbi:MAG: hypothetical protein JJT90_16050 [Ectothiorhodospiraceae bacterium]|nr:hypothetical protein [Ectothiorhodospiraceae bacterium]
MAELGRGLFAGFAATLVISALMIMRLEAGFMTWFNPIEIMNLSAHQAVGTPNHTAVGWGVHFIVGTAIWGGLFVALVRVLPGTTYTRKGLLFGVLAWLLVMLTVFPMAGSGLFGMGFGVIVPLSTLIAHLVFGAVLGSVYGWLKPG